MIIDAHVHFWNYDRQKDAWITDDMKLLQQHYLPEHILPVLKNNKVSGVVAVQADQSETETLFLKELSLTHPVIKGVVGWVDLQSDTVEERLQYFSSFPLIKGFRHVVQEEPEGFLLRSNFLRGVKALRQYDYTYDILVYAHQLKNAVDFADKIIDQPLILDHCAKPEIRNKAFQEWQSMIAIIAQQPNVYCKLSGLLTEAKWKEWRPADIYPYLDVVFNAFGTDRLLFGSDWPVVLLSGMYVQWKSLLEKYMEHYSPEERQKVFGDNAVKFYKL